MAARPSSVSPPPTGQPVLVPQGRHAGKPNLPLTRPCLIAGASSKSHFHLVSPTISKNHAAMVQTDVGVYIRDLASRTHVLVNGKQVREALLNDGDTLDLGAFSFLFRHRAARAASVPKAAADGAINVRGEKIPIPIEGRTLLIGRKQGCDIHLLEPSVSNCHALIFELNGVRCIRDLHSRTGTFVNGKAVHQQQLEFDDDIRIGDTEMRYTAAAPTSEEIDELEDLVGTARLADDDVALLGSADADSVRLEPDIPELAAVKRSPAIKASVEGIQPAPPAKVPQTIAATPATPVAPPVPIPVLPVALPLEPDEYELAPAPSAVKRPPQVATPIPLEPVEPAEIAGEAETPTHITSEAEIDFPAEAIPLAPLPAEEEKAPHADSRQPAGKTAITASEHGGETSHLISSGEEPSLEEDDLAVPDTSSAGTVALDASELEGGVLTSEDVGRYRPFPIHPEKAAEIPVQDEKAVSEVSAGHESAAGSEEAPGDAPQPTESAAELEIPFATDVVDPGFDELIEGELQPAASTADVQDDRSETDSAHLETESFEAQPAEVQAVTGESGDLHEVTHETTAHDVEPAAEAPAQDEPVAEVEIPFAHPVADQAFDALIADGLQSSTPIEEGSPDLGADVEPAQPNIESFESPPAETLAANLQTEVAVTERAHDEAASGELPQEVPLDEHAAEPRASHEEPALVEPVAEAPAPDESVAETEIPFAHPVADPAFDALIADELQTASPVEEASHELLPEVETTHVEIGTVEPLPAESPVGEDPDVIAQAHDEPVQDELPHEAPLDEHVVVRETANEEPAHAEPVADAPAPDEPVAEMEIRFAHHVADPAFDALIADELQSPTPVEEASHELLPEVETSHAEIGAVEPPPAESQPVAGEDQAVIAEAHDQPVHDELPHEASPDEHVVVHEPANEEPVHAEPVADASPPEESIAEMEIPFAHHVADPAFDALIEDELQSAMPIEEASHELLPEVETAHGDVTAVAPPPAESQPAVGEDQDVVSERANDEPVHDEVLEGATLDEHAAMYEPANEEPGHAEPVADAPAPEESLAEMEIPLAHDVADPAFDAFLPEIEPAEPHDALIVQLPAPIVQTSLDLAGIDVANAEDVVLESVPAQVHEDISETDSLIAQAMQTEFTAESHDQPSDHDGELTPVDSEHESHQSDARHVDVVDSLIAGALHPEGLSEFPNAHGQTPDAATGGMPLPMGDADFDHLITEALKSPASAGSLSSSPLEPAPAVIDQTPADEGEVTSDEPVPDLFADEQEPPTHTLTSAPDVLGQDQTVSSTAVPPIEGVPVSVFEDTSGENTPAASTDPVHLVSTWSDTELGRDEEIAAALRTGRKDFFDDVLDEVPGVAAGGQGIPGGTLEEELTSSTAQAAEVIEPTEPTPESAQTLAAELPISPESSTVIESSSLTDSTFARDVSEFAEPSLEPIVESNEQGSNAPGPHSDDHDQPPSPADGNGSGGNGSTDIHSGPHAHQAVSEGAAAAETAPAGAGESSAAIAPAMAAGAAAEIVAASIAPRSGRRFSFWPFGRKRAASPGPQVSDQPAAKDAATNGGEPALADSDTGIDITPSDPSLTITSSSTIDLAPPPESSVSISSSSSLAPEADVGGFLNELAPPEVLDEATASDDANDSRAGSLEAINFVPAEFAPSPPATSSATGWDNADSEDGLELEPLSGGTAAAVAPETEPEAEIVTEEAFEHSVAVDEVVADLPAEPGELEIAVEQPLPQLEEPALHVSPESMASTLAAELQSPLPIEFETQIDGGSIETDLAALPADEIAVIEPAPVALELPGHELNLPDEVSLPLPEPAPLLIDHSPEAFEPTEVLTIAEPLEFTASAPSDLPPVVAPEIDEIPAGDLHSIDDVAIPDAPPQPMVTGGEQLILSEPESGTLPSVDITIPAESLSSTIAFDSEPPATVQISPQPSLPWDDIDLESAGVAPPATDLVSESPPLELDASQAPALAVDDSELASLAAETREILAHPTPPPLPRAAEPPLPPPPTTAPLSETIVPASFTEEALSAEVIAAKVSEPIAELDFATEAPPESALAAPQEQEPDLSFGQEADTVQSPVVSPPTPPIAAAQGEVISTPVDPFMGMGRDLGSFLGGMPLDLSAPALSVAPIPAIPLFPLMPPRNSVFAPASPSVEPAAPATEVAPDIVTADASLAEMLANEGPREELFESTPESLDTLPDDSMGPISDVVEVLGEEPHGRGPTGPSEPHATEPAAPPVPFLATPPAQPGAQPPPHTPAAHMPPRPRLTSRSRTRSVSPFDFGSQPGADISIPAFGAPATPGSSIPSGRASSQFAGLSTPQLGDTDPFGMRKADKEPVVPPIDPAQRGNVGMLTALSAAPPEAPALRVRSDAAIPRQPRGVGLPPLESRPPRAPLSSPLTVPSQPPRPTGPSPSPRFEGLPPIPPPAPVNLHLRVVLPIIVALALATAAAIWFFYHVSGTAEGRLGFDNLENLRPSDKRNFELAEQNLLRKPEMRNFALRLFRSQNVGQPDGFLGDAAAAQRDYDEIVTSAGFAPNSKDFVLTADGPDPNGDAKRLAAVILNLYNKNLTLRDDAASKKQRYEQAEDAVDSATAQIKRLTPVLDEERAAASQLETAEQALKQDTEQSAVVWKAWTDAAARLQAAQAAVDSLDVASAGASPANGGSQQSSDNTNNDPQIKALVDQLAAANASLTQSRGAQSQVADAANKALDQALANFRESVNQAQGSLKEGSQLSAYLVAAQQAQDTIHQIHADLVDREKKEQQRLSEFRRVVAEKQEARLKAVWAADSQLQEMDQDLSVAEHRYNAAVGSGLDADAAELKTEVESLKNKIDARRDLISTGDIYADEVKQLQQFVDESLKDMESDRARADARMGDMLKALSAAAPNLDKLPADQQALEASLKKQLDAINIARQQQAQAIAQANPETDASVRKLEGSITELQAKIDARRKQLADDTHKQLTSQQVQDRVAKLSGAKAALAAAQMEEADASTAVRAKKVETDAAYSKVEELRAKSANLKADNARLLQLQAQLPDLQSQAEALLADWHHVPVPENPGETGNARATNVVDFRMQWILVSTLGYAILTAVMLAVWGISHRRHHELLTQPGMGGDFEEYDDEDDTGDSSELMDVLEERSPSGK